MSSDWGAVPQSPEGKISRLGYWASDKYKLCM